MTLLLRRQHLPPAKGILKGDEKRRRKNLHVISSHADASNGLSSSQPPFLSKSWSMRPGGVERLHGESHPEPLVPTLTSLSGNPELSPLNLSRAASQVNSRTTSPLATPSFDYPKHAPIVTPTKFATTSTAGSSGSDSRGAAGSIQARFVIVESTEVSRCFPFFPSPSPPSHVAACRLK